jgi:hypothetical protein
MPVFTAPEAWYGSTFELTLDLGPESGYRLIAAATALWSHPALRGCYLDADREPSEQRAVRPDDVMHNAPETPLRGLATLPNGTTVACSSHGLRIEGEADQLVFELPLGSLATAYPIGAYPYDDGTPLAWRATLEDWLFGLAQRAWHPGRVRAGTIGAGVAGYFEAADALRAGVPAERWEAYIWPSPAGPQLHPANMPAPLSR